MHQHIDRSPLLLKRSSRQLKLLFMWYEQNYLVGACAKRFRMFKAVVMKICLEWINIYQAYDAQLSRCVEVSCGRT